MILYFSGTGNTRAAAHRLAKLLGDKAVAIDAAADHPRASAEGAERVVWCFPTYSWGLPPAVVRYIRTVELEGAGKAVHHMVTTCGDDMGLADRQWRRLTASRGWEPGGAFAVIMPNTYVLMKGFNVDPPEVAASKLAQAPARLAEIARRIAGGGGDMLVRGRFAWIKSRIIYPWFCRFEMSPRPFHATAGCTGCGTCARSCPMHNITMADGEPNWADRCALCLRCYHICPRRAVAYGKATDGKGQYLAPGKLKI